MSIRREIIVVRSLAESDLSLFEAHRKAERSRQRAININALIVQRLLSSRLYEAEDGSFMCQIRFGTAVSTENRPISKPGKNWRLGGNKIAGDDFAALDSKDFMLLRSLEGNDGSDPLAISFISRNADAVLHAGLVATIGDHLNQSMAVFPAGSREFTELAKHCPGADIAPPKKGGRPSAPGAPSLKPRPSPARTSVTPMPQEGGEARGPKGARSVREKIRSPVLMERMLQVAGDLSGPAQLRFMETVEALATQLRELLLANDLIVQLQRSHSALWNRVAGQPVGFVDGGLANLSMLGSAPVAARVGGYVVTPGDRSPERESFTVLKYLIDELYASESGVYEESFPDLSALRDAARISIEAAGAVRLATEHRGLRWLMLHGALVNPVSRYTDKRQDGRLTHQFPAFSDAALSQLVPGEAPEEHANRVFVSVYRRQLELLQQSEAVVCGVVERESSTSSVCLALINTIDDDIIRDLMGREPDDWRHWFREALNPAEDGESEGQRISDSFLFRCVLEPGEALRPVVIDRNDQRRAPKEWWPVIEHYPKPWVTYLQPTEWNAPVRVELFEKDLPNFVQTAELIFHCALLMPRYAFPVGLQIVDQFAKIPDWISRPVNTYTTVSALKRALDSGNMNLFDNLRRMLCGSSREWLLRPVAGR